MAFGSLFSQGFRAPNQSTDKRSRNRLRTKSGRFAHFQTLSGEPLEPRLLLTVAVDPDQPIPSGLEPVAIQTGFVDQNSTNDLLAASTDGQLLVALNADGNDAWDSIETTNLGLGPLHGMVASRLNNDPFLDIAVQAPSAIHVLHGDGNGAFQLKQSFDAANANAFAPLDGKAVELAAGMLNLDLAVDLVSVAPADNQLLVFYGSTSDGQAGGTTGGTLDAPLSLPSGGVEPRTAVIGDVIGDAQPDVVVGHADGTLTFFSNHNSQLAIHSDLSLAGLGEISGLELADVDSDGDLDIVVSGGTQVTVLLNDDDTLTESPIENGEFEFGLTGWQTEVQGHGDNATPGRINAQGGFAQLHENESFLVSLYQSFQVPPAPETLSFHIESLGLDLPAGGIPDAFEVSLLAQDGSSLVPTHRPQATSFLNVNAPPEDSGLTGTPAANANLAAGVTFDGKTVALDISALPAGTTATLYFDLIGNPPGTESVVAIDAVTVSPDQIFTNTFTPSPLAGPFVDAAGLDVGDVDGDGFVDLVVADAGADALVVFNGSADGSWTRSDLDISAFGQTPLAVELGQLTTGDTIDDIAVSRFNSAKILTPLGSNFDNTPPNVTFLDPSSGATVDQDIASFTLQFTEDVLDLGPTANHSVTNPAAYELINLGPNGVYDSAAGDDLVIPIATIDYDSQTFTATLHIDSSSLPLIDGQYQLTVAGSDPQYAIQDLFGNSLKSGDDAVSKFQINTPPVIATGPNITENEGAPVSLSFDFSDPGYLDQWNTQIDWGDGTVESANLTQIDGVGTITAVHHYADNGEYPVRLTVTDQHNPPVIAERLAFIDNVAPQPVPLETQTVSEGEPLNIAFDFLDPGFTSSTASTEESFSATVDWGDGTVEPAIISVTNGGPSIPTTGTVSTGHTYQQDGTYEVIITLSDDDQGIVYQALQYTVVNAAPEFSPITAIVGHEGNTVTLTAPYSDPGVLDEHTWTIDWGDASFSSGTNVAGQTAIQAEHIYADDRPDDYVISVQLTDNAGDSATATTSATIQNVAPTLTAAQNQTVAEGSTLTLDVATFTDPGFDNPLAGTFESFTASIDWGDGTVESASVTVQQGSFGTATTGTIAGSHAFDDQGQYLVTVEITDDDQGVHTDSFLVTVNNAAPEITSLSVDPLTGIGEGQTLTLTADFTDPSPVDTHTATVWWGDGSSSTAQVDPATRTVTAEHIYADNGTYPITLEVVDNDSAATTASLSVTVDNVDPTLILPSDREIRTGVAETISVAFEDPGFTNALAGTTETFTATIDWGDGQTTDPATVIVTQGSAGTFTEGIIQATHTYDALGTYTVTVTLQDDDGNPVVGSFQITSIAKFYVVDQSAHKTFRYGAQMGLLNHSELDQGNSSVRGATTDPLGTKLWVVDAGKYVYVYDRDGTLVGSWKGQDLTNPNGIANDGDNIYVVNVAKDQVHFYLNATQYLSGQYTADLLFDLHPDNKDSSGIVTDGQWIWVTNDKETTHESSSMIWQEIISATGLWTRKIPSRAASRSISPTETSMSSTVWTEPSIAMPMPPIGPPTPTPNPRPPHCCSTPQTITQKGSPTPSTPWPSATPSPIPSPFPEKSTNGCLTSPPINGSFSTYKHSPAAND